MGASLAAGRDYTWADAYEHHYVAIVSEGLAKAYWGSAANALGKQIRGSQAEPWREVIGVAPDIHFDALNKPPVPQVYWQLLMDKFEGEPVRAERMTKFVVRSKRAGSEAFAEELRKAVWAIDPALPIAEVKTMQAYLSRSLARTSFTVVLLSVAAGMALLLGLIGIYAVIAYSVTQRRREIGVRVAIGARPGQVLALFIRSGFLLSALGILIGTALSSALLQVMSSLLFGVSAVDAPTYIGASIALLMAAMLASYIPSRRALKVDPAEALRTE
jgi:hypothetical protein